MQGKFEFDINAAGIVYINYVDVKTVRAKTHTYRVTTLDRNVYYGILDGDTTGGTIYVIGIDTTVKLAFNSIADIGFFDKFSYKTFNGYMSAGYSYTRSSGIGRLNFDGLITLNLRKWESTFQYSSIITYTDSVWTTDRLNAGIDLFHWLNATSQIGAIINYQRNIELGLARRFQEGAVYRYKLINKMNLKLWLFSGLMLNQEKNLEGEVFPTQLEVPFNVAVNIYRFNSPQITINTSQAVFFSITQPGRIRQDGNIRVDWTIIDDLDLSLQFYHSYDNQPVGVGAKNLDYGTVIGIKFNLGDY